MVIIQIIMLKGNMMINRGIWGSPISRKRIQGGIPDASKSSWKSSSNLVIESFGFQTDFQVDGFLFAYWHHSWVVSLQSMQVKSVRVNLVCSLQTLWKYVCVDPPHQNLQNWWNYFLCLVYGSLEGLGMGCDIKLCHFYSQPILFLGAQSWTKQT